MRGNGFKTKRERFSNIGQVKLRWMLLRLMEDF